MRRRMLLDALAATWERSPPETPVIAAGSTGTIPATGRLLGRIAGLPQGMVVLPGLDLQMDDVAWNDLGESHPQMALRTLLETLGADRNEVAVWPLPGRADLARGNAGRRTLLSDALLPPESASNLRDLPVDPAALDGLELAPCGNPREEAHVAALRMRWELETPGRTVALVTRDRTLARRVATTLRRWSVAVDDSAGEPLATTPAGTFFRLVAQAASARWAPVPLLAVLKHPFLRLGRQAGEVRALTRRLETVCLRGPRPAPGLEGLIHALPPDGSQPDLVALVSDLRQAVEGFDTAVGDDSTPLSALVTAHVAALESLAHPTSDSQNSIWQNDDGEALQGFVSELLAHADALGPVDGAAYPALIDTLMAQRSVRARFGSHPRAFIWGPLEARMQHADCVILAGLVEGSWPPEPPGDPWMSRPMRERFGLPTPEQRIGQAAHDFVQAACADTVLMLYAERAGGAPTVPSRWLVRLTTLLDVHGLGEIPLRKATVWRRWEATLDRPPAVEPATAPEPRPPVEARPTHLSVTQVETWQRDPYATYADQILELKSLDDLDEDADAATRGSFIHEALEQFVKNYPDTLPEDAEDRLIAIGRDILGPMLDRPAVASFWWRRFERVAAWFVSTERSRREDLRDIAAETRGRLALEAPGAPPFELSAKADRLERRRDGTVTIVDYKSGALPSHKAVQSGRAPQLPLEAAMVAQGAFAAVGASEIAALEFWSLSGGEPPGRIQTIPGQAADIGTDALEGLKRLVSAFAHPSTPYLDHPSGAEIGPFDRYSDIARTSEWRLGWRSLLDDVLYGDVPRSRTHRPRSANSLQQTMSDPELTVWVGASAGTGKTKVLTDRVLRLLLGGTPAARILCLTFTRAASAEMANRIRAELAGWTAMSDSDLREDLLALKGEPASDDEIVTARRLFAEVLDAPGGLQIATIHSFCQSLLGRFPLEAGIAPHFGLIEDRDRTELLREARDAVIGRIAGGQAPTLQTALDHLIVKAGESRAGDLLNEVCDQAERLDRLLGRAGSLEQVLAAIAQALDVDPNQNDADLVAEACDSSVVDRDRLSAALEVLASGKKSDRDRAGTIAAFLEAAPGQRQESFDTYLGAYLTAKGEARASLATKEVAQASPDAVATLEAEQARLLAVVERRHALASYRRTHAIIVLGHAILEDFRKRKRDRAVLDYGDLIDRTQTLLTQQDMAPWVLFKLDGGLDHVLVDEAQDTSPGQWAVVLALIEEFMAGEGAREERRTLFVVGDEKQSIFSFQGADLEALQEVRNHLRDRVPAPEWFSASLDLSYRSVPAVLEAVDAVFADPAAASGVAFDDTPIRHASFRERDGGMVELWPLLREVSREPGDPWTACLTDNPPDDRYARLADAIAERIAAMTGDDGGAGDILASRGTPIRAGDVMILVRRRSAIVPSLVRALRRAGVSVAGVDRMDLTGEIVVRDLLALARACLLPEDDIALASVLKGPFVGLGEEQLFDLAWRRPRQDKRPEPLWQTLRRRSDENQAFARATRWLAALMDRVDFLAPFEFFETVLTEPCATSEGFNGRKALTRRLGLGAHDPLDEFLNLALAYEHDHPPSLQGFAWWLGSGTAEVKREAEAAGDAVRIMTVHGAKGLQAPVVFLIDELSRPGRRPALLWDEATGLPLWAGREGERDRWSERLLDAHAERAAEEERRLLYVAMTRASDRLHVCGCTTESTKTDGTWFGMIHNALEPLVDIEKVEEGALRGEGWDGATLRLTCPQERRVVPPADDPDAVERVPPIDDALRIALLPERPIDRPISPSRLGGGEAYPRSPLDEQGSDLAMRRGRVVHRLLELLPECAPESRDAMARRLAALYEPSWPEEIRDGLCTSVTSILSDPQFASLFGAGSRAEVSVSGTVADTVIAGQVDRLVVGRDEIKIVDFKTGRQAPDVVTNTPVAYLRQLAAYREILRKIYPSHRVSCALLWTDIPHIVVIPADLLDTHSPAMRGTGTA